MLLMCFLQLFLDSSAAAMSRFYLQKEHWQTSLSIRFELQRSYSKVLRDLSSSQRFLLCLFLGKCYKSLFRWLNKWFLSEVFPHIAWLVLLLIIWILLFLHVDALLIKLCLKIQFARIWLQLLLVLVNLTSK